MLRYRAAASAHAGVSVKLNGICRLLAGHGEGAYGGMRLKRRDRCDLVLDAYVLMY